MVGLFYCYAEKSSSLEPLSGGDNELIEGGPIIIIIVEVEMAINFYLRVSCIIFCRN